MAFSDVPLVVVDTETTGGRAASDRLIEIAAVRIENGTVVDRFEQLVNPERTVPRRITRLTGISTAMVFDQPVAADVLPSFRTFLGSGVFAAHSLSFDLRFLNEEHARAGLPALPNATLCTLRLARRLLPGLRSKGLSSLADFFGIRVRRRHRALDDAEATAEVLLRFLDQLELEYGFESVEDVLAFQRRRYADLKRISTNVAHIRENVLSRLPRAPGVYFMKDAKGKIIYVGKARYLNDRVRSYFSAVEGHPPRIRKMVRSVRDVDWQETDSELEALLLESQLIKELQPAYNRAQRRYVNRPFVRIDTTHPYPRITTSAFLHHDGAEYYGPMASRQEAAFVVDVIDRFFRTRECEDETFARGQRCAYASMGRCTAPCEGGAGADRYHDEVNRVRAFLNGHDESVCGRIEAAMAASSEALEFEQAATYRDWLKALTKMLARRSGVASRVLQHNTVILHRPSADDQVRVLAVSRGRHAETLHVGVPPSSHDLGRIRRMLRRCYAEPPDDLESYKEKEIDEMHVLTRWLYAHRNEIVQVNWDEDSTVTEVADRISAAVLEFGRDVPSATLLTISSSRPTTSKLPHASPSSTPLPFPHSPRA